jgi:hypothetical protein
VPSHNRMREFDRDLIRGGHYGQRSCEPHLQAEHMAAPTNAAYVKKALANSEPSTHGTFETCRLTLTMSVNRGIPEVTDRRSNRRANDDPSETSTAHCGRASDDGLPTLLWNRGFRCFTSSNFMLSSAVWLHTDQTYPHISGAEQILSTRS